jgi:hypothetical protein
VASDNGGVADSGALRARRHRQHRSGDHSLCRKNCAGVQRGAGDLRRVSPASERFTGVDPETELEQLARRLAEDYEADRGNALLARELRMTLQSLKPGGPPQDAALAGLLDELRAT